MNGLQVIRAEQRHDRHRIEIRSEQGEHDSQRQRAEQILAHAKQKRHRKEHDHGDQHDGQDRQRDFVGPLDGRDRRVFAHLQVAVDVFNHHHGVVDQPRKRQRQPAEHHGVDRIVGAVQNEKCDEHRNGNG